MTKGIFKKKRNRLIALLVASCAFLALGIGGGAAALSRAAAVRKGPSKRPSHSLRSSSKTADFREALFTPSQKKAAMAALGSEVPGGVSGSYSSFPGQVFSSYIGVTGGLTSSITGQQVKGSIFVPQGVDLELFGPNFSDTNGTFYNPNTLSEKQLLGVLEGGGYVGAVTIQAGNSQLATPLLGLVSSSGQPWTQSEIQNSGISSTGTLQNEFMSKCMGYNWKPADPSAFTPGGPTEDETIQHSVQQGAGGIVADGVLGSVSLEVAAPDIESGLKAMGYSGKKYDEALESIKEVFSDKKMTSFQEAFMKWYHDRTDANLASAVSLAQDLLKGEYGKNLKKELPLVCEAVWNGAVQFNEYENGSLVQTGGWTDIYSSGNDLNGNSSNQYVANYAASGYGPVVKGCGNGTDGCGIKVTVDSLGSAFIYDMVGTDFKVSASYIVDTTDPSSAAYSSPGAVVQNMLDVNDGTQYNNFFVRQTGTSPTLFNPTSSSIPAFSPTSTPSASGLWFKAIDEEGGPLKQVKVLLTFVSSPASGVPQTLNGSPIDPFPITGPNFNGDSYGGPEDLNSLLSSGKTTSNRDGGLIGYMWYGQSGATTQDDYALITLNQVSGQDGVFEVSGLPFGIYDVSLVSGENQEGQNEEYGSYYASPSFQVNLNSYSASSTPEKMSAIQDPCGFVDPSQDEVVVGAQNPSSGRVEGSSVSSSPFTATVGKDNPYTYQAQAYLPFDLSNQTNSYGDKASSSPLSFSVSTPDQGVEEGSVKANGILLSSLSGASVSVSSSNLKVTLSPSALSYIESHGQEPVGGSSGELSQNGDGARILAIEWENYLEPSFTPSSPSSATYEFDYKAYSAANPNDKALSLSPAPSTNGPADNSVPSSLTVSSDSSQTGLWFKDLDADGSPSSGAKFTVKNSEGQYLNEEKDSSGAFTGWGWASSPSSAVEFSQRNSEALFTFGGLANGTYTVTLHEWPDSMGSSPSSPSTGKNNWPNVSPEGDTQGPKWAGYPGTVTGAKGYDGSFTVKLDYSSPEVMSAAADPAGIVDSSKDSIYSLSPVKMAPMEGSSLSSDSYKTETVGIPFTEGWEGYLPMAVTPSSTPAGENGYSSEMLVAFPENGSGLDSNGNSPGLEMDDPSASDIEVAGVPLSTLVKNGAEASSSNGDYEIRLPYAALEYLEENGKNVEGSALSSSSNRLIYITFPAVLTSSFKNGGKFQQWMSMGTNASWWTQRPGGDWGVYSDPLYTNGPADNSLPSSLSMSSASGDTGIWFKSLWWGQDTPAKGAKFTVSQVQNGKTAYLAPTVNNDGAFTGWTWQGSPYDFTEQNDQADFSFGGLSDGTYTVTEVNPASGADPSKLSFTTDINYSSPESIKAVSDPLNLVSPSKGVVYNVITPSSLPFTGGRWVLAISVSAALLFGFGAAFFFIRKRKRA